jgi:hypothetical protein
MFPMRAAILLATCLSAFWCSAVNAQQMSDRALVDSLYPEQLTQEYQRLFHDVPDHDSDFARIDLEGNGHPLLVAVYSNGCRGAVRVIDNNRAVLSEAFLPDGGIPELETVDLEGDGKLELEADFRVNASAWTYFLRWRDQTLHVIAFPTELAQPLPMDIDGDGRLEVIDTREMGDDSLPGIYSVSGDAASQTASFVFMDQYLRDPAWPPTESASFVADPEGSYVITAVPVEGERPRAVISINGIVVLRPEDFKPGQPASAPVNLLQQNSIEVTLRSAPESGIRVLVLTTKVGKVTKP